MKISELPVASAQDILNDGTIIVNDIVTNEETGEESILTKQILLKDAVEAIAPNGGGSGSGITYTAGQNISIDNGVISADLSGKQDTLTTGTGIEINNNVISATLQPMTGASTAAAGTAGAVPAPTIADKDKFLKGDGTWAIIPAGSNYTAGNGITINGSGTISVDPDNVFNTGTGIDINNGTISVDLYAGTGIDINGDTISANPNNIFNYVGSGINIEDGAIQLNPDDIFSVGNGIAIENGTISTDPNSIFNTGDGITIENGTISVNSYIENIIDSEKLVPSIPSGNDKKVLIADRLGDGILWGDVNTVIWDYIFDGNGSAADEGAILVAGASGNPPHWEYLIPEHSSADVGKVLTVQDDGTLAWELPSTN